MLVICNNVSKPCIVTRFWHYDAGYAKLVLYFHYPLSTRKYTSVGLSIFRPANENSPKKNSSYFSVLTSYKCNYMSGLSRL